MTFEEARAAFPVLERVAYLNAGTMGPLSSDTVAAMAAEQKAELERGRGHPRHIERMRELRKQARSRLATLLAVPPEHVTLTASTTQGCNLVLAGLDLGPDDEVVTTDVEHFGLLGALHTSGARVRVAHLFGRRPEAALELILAELGPRTRLIALSHVAWVTGHALPVREVKERVDLPVLVDGAQSAGAIRVDAGEFDFYAVSCQKWLCGPDATGALYVRDPERLRVTAPSYFSMETHDETGRFEPRPGAVRFDPGWIPPSSLAGLVSALDSAPDWRFERAAQLTERCRQLLAAHVEIVTEPGHATLVSFRAGEDAAELVARAYDAGVFVREVPGRRLVRVSCGYWTSEDDLQRLVDVVDASG